MNLNKRLWIISLILVATFTAWPQEDTTHIIQKCNAKEGIAIAGLPVLAYDADMGFQYGLILNLQHFGDGTLYPEYKHNYYFEVSRFTRGSGVNQFFFDSKYLIPGNIRLTADISYLTEKALDFYGFNGYEVAFHEDFMDDGSDDYISRMFYRHERKWFRFITDFQGYIKSEKLRWLAGISIYNIKTKSVDIEKLNKKKPDAKKLPEIPLLYDHYVGWGFISEKEKDGGHTNFLKLGLVYDTRDNESNPTRGLWDEVIVMTAPSFLLNKEFAFTKLAVTHRQYLNLVKRKLTFCYLLSYQGTIQGETPFYLQPLLISSYSLSTKSDGLGGAKTLRGILRNRAVGDGFVYGNFELRWKFFETVVLKQNFYFALHGFMDAGQVVQPVAVDRGLLPEGIVISDYFDADQDAPHISYGAGLRIAWNENFIIAVDYGFAADRRDGRRGLYLGINNLF